MIIIKPRIKYPSKMKYKLTFLILFVTSNVYAQSNFTDFFEGIWKMENKDIYEHWDILNKNSLKGFSYTLKNGQIAVIEYLDITQIDIEIIYTAAVLNQNQDKGISFKLTKSDSTFTFENPDHNFPKKIVYQKLSDSEMFVEVSDGMQKGFSYKMTKQNTQANQKDSTVLNPSYDPELAQKLGADDYGMKSYILVILKTGSNQTTDREFISECFRGHLDNINRLVEDGKLVVAGPLGKNDKTYRGIFILNLSSLEEAHLLLQKDPAIKVGLLETELYTWYGSAALPEYLPPSDKIWKLKP